MYGYLDHRPARVAPDTLTNISEVALCVGEDPDIFFSKDERTQARALKICQPCNNKVECLNRAHNAGIKEGVWGGKVLG